MPVIRVQDQVAKLANDDELIAFCTDPGVLNDIPAWCRINGHELLTTEQVDDEYRITIKVVKDGS